MQQKGERAANAQELFEVVPPTQPTPQQQTVFDLQREQQKQLNSGEHWNIKAPSDKDIGWGSFLGSMLVSLAVGAATGNKASMIAAGGLAAITIHDEGYARREREQECQKLLDQGYSYDAVYEWYKSGKNDSLKANRAEMEKAREFNASNALANQREADLAGFHNAQLGNQNVRNQILAAKAGYNIIGGGNENALGSADAFEQYVRSHEGGQVGQEDYMKSGHYGTHQQNQAFYNENGGQGDVRQATEEQEAATTRNFYNRMKQEHPSWTDAQIASAYHDGPKTTANAIEAGKANNTPWYTHLGPEGQKYVADFYKTSLVPNGASVGGKGLISATDGPHQVETTKDGAPKQYVGDNGEHYFVDVNTGQKVPVGSVISQMTPQEQAVQNQFNRDYSTIMGSSDDAFTPIVGQIQGGGLGSPAWGAETLSGMSGAEARNLYKAATEINGMMLTKGIGAARSMGASGINTKDEAEMYFAAMPRLDFSSEDALKSSLNDIKTYTDDWNSAHSGYMSSGNGNSNSGQAINTGITDSQRSAYGY